MQTNTVYHHPNFSTYLDLSQDQSDFVAQILDRMVETRSHKVVDWVKDTFERGIQAILEKDVQD